MAHGEELLDWLRARNQHAHRIPATLPALILMDLNMPRMNGNEALRQIRADPGLRALPVMILSTSDNQRQIAQAYSEGANAFITKPARFDDVVRMVSGLGSFWLTQARLP